MRHEKLEMAVARANSEGLTIINHGILDRSSGELRVDPFGACMYAYAGPTACLKVGWLNELCAWLKEDKWWVHRFSMGFDRSFPMMRERGNGQHPEPDEVAHYGLECQKRWLRHGTQKPPQPEG